MAGAHRVVSGAAGWAHTCFTRTYYIYSSYIHIKVTHCGVCETVTLTSTSYSGYLRYHRCPPRFTFKIPNGLAPEIALLDTHVRRIVFPVIWWEQMLSNLDQDRR